LAIKLTTVSIFVFMIISWLFGIYSLSKFYTPTIIIPIFNNYYWSTPFVGMLGLTVFFSIVSVAAFFILKLKKFFLHKKDGRKMKQLFNIEDKNPCHLLHLLKVC